MASATLKVLLNGNPVGENTMQEGELLRVGRIGCGNDIELDDTKVSRNHARIALDGGRVLITDLGSTNATLINGVPIPANSPQAVKHGDVVKFSNNGKFEMLVTIEGEVGNGANEIPETKKGFHYQGQGSRPDLKPTEIGGEEYGKTQIGDDGQQAAGKKPKKAASPDLKVPRIPGVSTPRMPSMPNPPGISAPRIPGVGRPPMPHVNIPRTPGKIINAASELYGETDYPESEQGIQKEYAGFWLRFVAAILDSLILGLIIGIPGTIILSIVGVATITSLVSDAASLSIGLIILFVMTLFFLLIITPWLYYSFFESASKQATPGKMILGIQVADMNGQKISFLRATGRYLGRSLSGILFIGYIIAGFTEKKQALHDLIAKTLVVKK